MGASVSAGSSDLVGGGGGGVLGGGGARFGGAGADFPWVCAFPLTTRLGGGAGGGGGPFGGGGGAFGAGGWRPTLGALGGEGSLDVLASEVCMCAADGVCPNTPGRYGAGA